MGGRMFLEVDGDQVTAVEMSGDLAVSSVTFDAGTVRDSLEAALSGFRQRRSDPPLEVSIVPPGFRFLRLDLTAEDFDDPSGPLAEVTGDSDFLPAIWMPSGPPEAGYTAPGYALAAAPELVEEVENALSRVRHRLFLSPSVVPGDGVWVGVHASCTVLSLVRDGLLTNAVQLPCGGIGSVAALVDPEDARRGMTAVVAALASASDASMLVEAELGRFYRSLMRSVASALEGLPGVDADVEVGFMGLGATAPRLEEAVRHHAFRPVIPSQLLLALNYLPVGRRLPSLAALSTALVSPPQLGSHMERAAAAVPARPLWPAAVSAGVTALAAAALLLPVGSQALSSQEMSDGLAGLPAHVASAGDLGRFLSEGSEHPQRQLLSQLPGLRVDAAEVSGFGWEDGHLTVSLSALRGAALDTPGVLAEFRDLTGVSDVEAAAAFSDGVRSTVVLKVGDFDDE